jgi:hypothetical protein
VDPADDPRGRPWTERVTAFAGAITAVAGFVVIPGSLAMLVRLERANLPADLGVVVSLPTQFLLAVGFGYVIGPLLLMVGLALGVTWLPGSRDSLTPALIPSQTARRWHFGVLGLFVVVVGTCLPFVVYGGSPPFLAFLLAVVAAIVFVAGAWLIGRLDVSRGLAFGLVSLAAALAFVGWAIAFAGVRADFPATTVCLKDGEELDGVLIGRTSDEFYVGEPENKVILLSIDDPLTRANIEGGLQGANVGSKLISDPEQVTFQRANVVIADVSEGLDLLRKPLEAGVPVIGYYPDEVADVESLKEEATDNGIAVIRSETAVRKPATLQRLLSDALATTPETRVRPPRRIASVPESEVIGYRLGAAGPCPIRT